MSAILVSEEPTFFVMNDGKDFRVPKHGLADHMVARIRAMKPKKMADGGEAVDPSMVGQQPLPDELASLPPSRPPASAGGGAGGGGGGDEPQGINPMGSFLDYMNSPVQPPKLLDTPTSPSIEDLNKARAEMGAPPLPAAKEPLDELTPLSKIPPKAAPKAAPAKVAPTAPAVPSELEKGAIDAAKALANAQMAQDKAEGDILANRQSMLEKSAADQADRASTAAQQTKFSMAQIQMANDYMQGLDPHIDKGHLWANTGVPGKIFGIIGLVLGAFGAARDGINHASVMLDKMIDQDLALQKQEYEAKFRQGQARVANATSMYGMYRQQGLDAETAAMAAKVTALQQSENAFLLAKSKTSDAKTQANLDQSIVNIKQKAFEEQNKLKDKLFDQHIKQGHLNVEWYKAMHPKGKAGEAEEATDKEIAAAGKALGTISSAELTTKNLRALQSKHGGKLPGLDFMSGVSGVLPGNLSSYLRTEDEIAAKGYIDDMIGFALQKQSGVGVSDNERKQFYTKYGLTPSSSPEARRAGVERALADTEANIRNTRAAIKPAAIRKVEERAGVRQGGGKTESAQIQAAKAWLAENPDSPDAPGVRAKLAELGAQ